MLGIRRREGSLAMLETYKGIPTMLAIRRAIPTMLETYRREGSLPMRGT